MPIGLKDYPFTIVVDEREVKIEGNFLLNADGPYQNCTIHLSPDVHCEVQLSNLHSFPEQNGKIQAEYARFSGEHMGIKRSDGSITEKFRGPLCEQVKHVQLSRFSVDAGMKGAINDAFTRDPIPRAKLVFSYPWTDLYQPEDLILPPEWGEE